MRSNTVIAFGLWCFSSSRNGVAIAFTPFLVGGNDVKNRCSVSVAPSSNDRLSRIFKAASSNDDASVPIFALNVILRIKPEARDKFLEVILNNQKGTLNKELEPLALEYIFGEDASEPNTFHFHEKYLGDEGIAAHNAAPHFLVWEEFAQTNPFSSPPEVYKYVIYND